MDILIEKRNVYGNDLIYPLTNVSAIQALTGQKTLSERHLRAFNSLGITFIEKPLAVLETHN